VGELTALPSRPLVGFKWGANSKRRERKGKEEEKGEGRERKGREEMYTVSQKNMSPYFCPYLRHIWANFKNSFTGTLCGKFAIN